MRSGRGGNESSPRLECGEKHTSGVRVKGLSTNAHNRLAFRWNIMLGKHETSPCNCPSYILGRDASLVCVRTGRTAYFSSTKLARDTFSLPSFQSLHCVVLNITRAYLYQQFRMTTRPYNEHSEQPERVDRCACTINQLILYESVDTSEKFLTFQMTYWEQELQSYLQIQLTGFN